MMPECILELSLAGGWSRPPKIVNLEFLARMTSLESAPAQTKQAQIIMPNTAVSFCLLPPKVLTEHLL